jgi:hypothetical protein
MRCQRCQFENIPGQTSCIRCGTTLEVPNSAIDVHPPRMAGWQKPFRSFFRWFRREKNNVAPSFDFHFPPWFKEVFGDTFLGLFLSVIPGFAHLVQRRFSEVRLYVLLWLILLLAGLFFYGSRYGFIMLGLSIGIHAGIALQYGIIKDLKNLGERLLTIVLVLICLGVLYFYIPRIIFPSLVGGYSTLTIPQYKTESGDYLLAWRNFDKSVLLPRGSLVRLRPLFVGGHGFFNNRNEEMVIGQIIGLPGEEIDIKEGCFVIDGQVLNVQQYPVPLWLKNRIFSDTIPFGSYFVSMEYVVQAHGALNTSYISQASMIKASAIDAKVFMKWWPINRRGMIKVD